MKLFATKPARRTSRHLNYLLAAFCAAGFFAVVHNTPASMTTLTFQPTPSDMDDLDHHMVYTWRLDNINLQNQAITSATLTFTNIRNWDSNPNILHLHLLDTARNSGVRSFVDDPTGSVPVTDLTDDFVSTRYHSDPAWLVANSTADTLLGNPSFTTTPGTYTLTFNGTQLTALRNYLANGNNLAFGLDPDCHYFNDGISFTMNLTPVPEVASFGPVLGLIAVAASSEILRRRRRRVPVSI